MIETQKSIYEFHRKHQFPCSLPLIANKGLDKFIMKFLCKLTLLISKFCIKYWKFRGKENESFYRFHLISEELAETMEPINNGELFKVCDGLGDLLYVVLGTFVTYRLPAKEIEMEICSSNNTKSARNLKTNLRLRNKGENFKPPNFEKVLEVGLKRLTKEKQF
jgi:hypothetical protein